MARKTKEDALATRDSILDAAERLFVAQGVSHTTLQHIATDAGLTRGAIYWHFEDKAALFAALMERAKMPLEAAMYLLEKPNPEDPLTDLGHYIVGVFRLTMEDQRARSAFEIVTLKMEFVGEMDAARGRRMQWLSEWMAKTEKLIGIAIAHGSLKPGVTPRVAALGLFALMDGLLRTWLLDQQAFDLVKVGQQIVDMHLDSLRVVK